MGISYDDYFYPTVWLILGFIHKWSIPVYLQLMVCFKRNVMTQLLKTALSNPGLEVLNLEPLEFPASGGPSIFNVARSSIWATLRKDITMDERYWG